MRSDASLWSGGPSRYQHGGSPLLFAGSLAESTIYRLEELIWQMQT